ncbi:MAG TPA: cytochrome c [Terriglobales bacterium]|jgi:cytochrome c oxidase cbb3-type subunit 3|nr:cytochrome c [Terriglobales bacterium]
MTTKISILVLLIALALVGCQRERREFAQAPAMAKSPESVSVTELHPANLAPPPPVSNVYSESAYDVNEGKRLFDWYNCSGCHFHGGGGIGPPLMDADWIYGDAPQNIFNSIVEGRPNGMPNFAGKIPEYQVWQLVAYVRSMSGQLPKDISPNRDDKMMAKQPESSTPAEHSPRQRPADLKPEHPR